MIFYNVYPKSENCGFFVKQKQEKNKLEENTFTDKILYMNDEKD